MKRCTITKKPLVSAVCILPALTSLVHSPGLHCCIFFFFTLLKGAEEQFLLFGEVHPDILRMPYYQDDEAAGYTRRSSRRSQDSPMPMEMDPIFDMDVLMSEFSDTLFSTLSSHQPIPWPNPREIGKFLHMMDMGYNNTNKVLYLVTICCFSQHMQVMQT